jgi:hypothetical protein
MRRPWREHDCHNDVLEVMLDKKLNQCKCKRLHVCSMALKTFRLIDCTKSIAIPNPSCNDARSRNAAGEMFLVCCRPLLDENERRSVMMFAEQPINGGAYCSKRLIGVRCFETGDSPGCHGEITDDNLKL